MARSNHRTTLPQSALAGCQLPQGGSQGTAVPFQRAARKPGLCGRFSSPLRNSDDFGFHSTDDTPSVSPCGLPAPSEREPGNGCTIQRAARKPQGCGRFSSPLRELRGFDILPFIRPLSPGMGYRFSNLFAPLVSSQRVSAAESAPNSAATAARYPFAPITFRVR